VVLIWFILKVHHPFFPGTPVRSWSLDSNAHDPKVTRLTNLWTWPVVSTYVNTIKLIEIVMVPAPLGWKTTNIRETTNLITENINAVPRHKW
jgi:hypothetical protein